MDLNFFYSENISINHSTLFSDSRNLTLLPFYQHSLAVASVIILAYVLIFSLCMLGNILVCFIVLKNRQMRTVTNIFILNLAISDLLVGILCLPITLVDNLITGKSVTSGLTHLERVYLLVFACISMLPSSWGLTRPISRAVDVMWLINLYYKTWVCFML